MSQDDEPEGPDLTLGVAGADIPEGGMLAGRVGEAAVLVARVEGRLFAIGAHCTHYHGPLAEGLIKDGAVRCPWHHARFSLATGEAVGAPAFDPVPCWRVETRGELVFVRERAAPTPPAPPAQAGRVLIVGGGAAGFAAAEMLARKGHAGGIVLVSDDEDAPYDRPNCSKDFLSGDAPPEWMPLRDEAFWRDGPVELRLRTRVEALDLAARTATLAGGERLAFDQLVLATGAEPQRPPAPGLEGPGVFVLRSLGDARAIVAAAQGARTVAVIGASFIGLEAAAAMIKRGLAAHVVAPERVPFEKILGEAVGRWAQRLHEDKGVVFHLGRKAQAFADGALTLDDGTRLAADMVVIGMGVKPRTQLAQAAGLAVDDGVVVDDRLRAAPGVFAVGDIARYPDPNFGGLIRVEHWVHAQRQGQHVARVILGEDAPFAEPPFFWSAHYDSAVHYDGHAERFDPPHAEGSVADYDATVRYSQAGRLLAVATLNRDMASLEAEAAFEARRDAAD